MIQTRERLVRLALVGIKFRIPGLNSGVERHVKRPENLFAVIIKKAARASLYREALPPFVRYAKAEHVCLLGSYRRHVRHLRQALR